jgi:hypothetical protein
VRWRRLYSALIPELLFRLLAALATIPLQLFGTRHPREPSVSNYLYKLFYTCPVSWTEVLLSV